MTLAPKTILHERYQIGILLGSGGMGAVYRAFDTLYDQPVAIKEFCLGHLPDEQDLPQDSPGGPPVEHQSSSIMTRSKAVALFKREAKILAALDHPNLPKVRDYFGNNDDYFLVMTLIEGQDLFKAMEERKWVAFPESTVLAWASQIMDALTYCHKKGLIHRDIKPANLICDRADKIYLVDFGVAKYTDPGKSTGGFTQVLTPRYSPPEQYTGKGLMDERVDVYSLGATLYTLLTGQQPPDAISRLTGCKLAAPRQVIPEISPAVEAAVLKALSLEQDKRFNSIKEMADILIANPAGRSASSFSPLQSNENSSTVIYNIPKKPAPIYETQPPKSRPKSALVQFITEDNPDPVNIKTSVTKFGRLCENSAIEIDIDLTPFDSHKIISRRHASIEFSNGDYFLMDDNSHNGTWLNGRKLIPGDRNRLGEGDTIQFGSIQSHGIKAVIHLYD